MGTVTISNKLSYYLGAGQIDFHSDVFQALLMLNGFTYDATSMFLLSDITEATWQASTVYAESDIIIPPTPNGHKYQIDTGGGGTSGASVPIFPTISGAAVSDGTCTWTKIGPDDQAPTANGYTQNAKTLIFSGYTQNPTTGETAFSWDDPSWIASGGYLGSADGEPALTAGALIVDATPTTPIIIGCLGFTVAGYTQDGQGLKIEGIEVMVSS